MTYDPQGQLDQDSENGLAMHQQLSLEADKFADHFREFQKCDEREARNIFMSLVEQCFVPPKEKTKPPECPLCSLIECTCLDSLPF